METQLKIRPYEMDSIVSYVNMSMEDALGKAGWNAVKYMILYRYKIDPETSDIILKRDTFRAAVYAMLGARAVRIIDRVLPETITQSLLTRGRFTYPI